MAELQRQVSPGWAKRGSLYEVFGGFRKGCGRGGSQLFYCWQKAKFPVNGTLKAKFPVNGTGVVLHVDNIEVAAGCIQVRGANRCAIETHSLFGRTCMPDILRFAVMLRL